MDTASPRLRAALRRCDHGDGTPPPSSAGCPTRATVAGAATATRDRRPPGANCSEAPNPSPGRALDVARLLESRAPPTPDDQGAASTRGAGLGPDLLAACRRPVHIILDVYRRARKGT